MEIKKYKYYSRYHCQLIRKDLSFHDYKLLSSLNDREIEFFFKHSKIYIQNLIKKIGDIVLFQKNKTEKKINVMNFYNDRYRYRYILSNHIGMKINYKNLDVYSFGLILLSHVDIKISTIYSLIINKPIIKNCLIIENNNILINIVNDILIG